MVLNTHFMGKLRQGAVIIAASLAACAAPEANADDPNKTTRAELTQAAVVTTAVAETKQRTMAECRVLADKAEKLACMKSVVDRRKAENAEKRDELNEINTTIEGLTKVVALQEDKADVPLAL